MKRRVLVEIIVEILGVKHALAEVLADDFLKSDFPLNGITTYGQAIAFLQYVNKVRGARQAAVAN